jgi:hypothetical protein
MIPSIFNKSTLQHRRLRHTYFALVLRISAVLGSTAWGIDSTRPVLALDASAIKLHGGPGTNIFYIFGSLNLLLLHICSLFRYPYPHVAPCTLVRWSCDAERDVL